MWKTCHHSASPKLLLLATQKSGIGVVAWVFISYICYMFIYFPIPHFKSWKDAKGELPLSSEGIVQKFELLLEHVGPENPKPLQLPATQRRSAAGQSGGRSAGGARRPAKRQNTLAAAPWKPFLTMRYTHICYENVITLSYEQYRKLRKLRKLHFFDPCWYWLQTNMWFVPGWR